MLRGLRILAVLADAARPLSLTDIADAVGLPSSTTHRVLQNLLTDGHAYLDGPGRYGLSVQGLQPLPLDHPINMLRRDALDLMRSLQADFGPSVLLFAYPGKQRMVVDYVAGNYSVTPYFDVRVSAPLHASVSGKLLLSGLPALERDQLLGAEPYAARTGHTLVTREALFQDLDEVATTGIATNLNENVQGICAIGRRLTTPAGGRVGALVLTGPASFFQGKSLERMRTELIQRVDVFQSTSAAVRAMARLFDR